MHPMQKLLTELHDTVHTMHRLPKLLLKYGGMLVIFLFTCIGRRIPLRWTVERLSRPDDFERRSFYLREGYACRRYRAGVAD